MLIRLSLMTLRRGDDENATAVTAVEGGGATNGTMRRTLSRIARLITIRSHGWEKMCRSSEKFWVRESVCIIGMLMGMLKKPYVKKMLLSEAKR